VEELLKGYLLGFAIAAPVGPIGLLCIRRTLAEGVPAGLASGLGAATADAMYGAVAALGLTAVSSLMVDQAVWLRLVGGLFLLYLGLTIFRSRPALESAAAAGRSHSARLAWAYGSTLLLTITNPATILSFGVAFAGLGLVGPNVGGMPAVVIVLGVFLGSACWWLLLSGAVGYFRARVGGGKLVWINRGSGVLLVGFGVVALLSVLTPAG
jgi:threonine/homoserine/homoserine lactone efflux protein